MAIFALLTPIVAAVHRFKRWREFRRGVAHFSFNYGSSILEKLPFPNFFRRYRRIPKYFDAMFCVGLGYFLSSLSAALGLWICFAGACVAFFEQTVRQYQIETNMDLMDGIGNAEAQGEVVEYFTALQPGGRSNARSHEDIPTGVADDVRESMKRRKAK